MRQPSQEEAVHFCSSLLLLLLSLVTSAEAAYSSYVVGGDLGWATPSDGNVNYTAWASNNTFSLGDTLVFHYTRDHTVVQTDLLKTFEACDSTSDDNSLQIWSSFDSTGATVELKKTGATYFFCSASDGVHCSRGQKFQIYVNEGAGLPLAPALAPASGGDDDDGDNDIPGFDNVGAPPPPPPSDDESSSSASRSTCLWEIALFLTALYIC